MWRFVGKAFSWEVSESATSIELFPEWHQLTPDMGGPTPDLEAEEVLALGKKSLRLKIIPGGYDHICRELRAQCRFGDLPFEAPINTEADVLVNSSDNDLEVIWYRDASSIQTTLHNLHQMSANADSSFYGFAFRSRFLVGQFSMGTNEMNKNHFMSGRLGAALESFRGMTFTCGKPMPTKPSDSSNLESLQDQFR